MSKFILLFASGGSFIALAFLLMHFLCAGRCHFYETQIGDMLVLVRLALWPSSIFLLATSGLTRANCQELLEEGFIVLLAMFANAILYGVIGGFVWVGLYKQRWVLYTLGGFVLWMWFKLFGIGYYR